ncbi:MAG: ATP-binding protein [Janthinobacterium lividum]
MASRIRSFQWENTPLGALAAWDAVLTSTVNMVLALRYPVQVLWGPERVLIYNDLWAPIYMDRHPEALGKPAAEFWADAWRFVGEEVDGVFRTGIATDHAEELIPVLRNGVVQDVWWDYSYNPVFGLDGRVAGILNISKDVTPQREAEVERARSDAALRAKQAELERSYQEMHAERTRLLLMIQQAPVFFALMEGPQHRITMVNSLYLKLVGDRDVMNRTVADALPEAVDQGYMDLLDRVFKSGETVQIRDAKFTIKRFHDSELEDRLIDFTCQPLREPNGSIAGVVAMGNDITDTKKAEQALIQNEKLAAVGRLSASIAHEINNPLEAITNLLYLARATPGSEEVDTYLAMADQELRRVSAIASQTLRFHKQPSRAAAVGAEMLLESVLHLYGGRMSNARVQLVQRMRATQQVLCLEGEIRQVLSNLVGNAIDAMNGVPGRLELRSRDARDWQTGEQGIVLTVADSGKGMSSATLAKVFEPFFTTKGVGGTGLGLWISAEIVARHRGRLSVRTSQLPGRSGTVFSLFLPAAGPTL